LCMKYLRVQSEAVFVGTFLQAYEIFSDSRLRYGFPHNLYVRITHYQLHFFLLASKIMLAPIEIYPTLKIDLNCKLQTKTNHNLLQLITKSYIWPIRITKKAPHKKSLRFAAFPLQINGKIFALLTQKIVCYLFKQAACLRF
jgi:hypothetical protein